MGDQGREMTFDCACGQYDQPRKEGTRMKRKLTMRIVSATVATQMLLTPVAHAASPLRDLVVTDQMERAAHNFIPMANYKQERAWGDMLHQANEITDGSTNVVATLEQVAAPEFILDSELEKELITPVVGDFPQNQPMESRPLFLLQT